MAVRLVTDSASDIPPAERERLGIIVVPLSVQFGDAVYIDGETLDTQGFYRMLATDGHLPRTSQPSVGRFEQVYREAQEAGDEVLSIHISSVLSGTFGAASLAARGVEGLRCRLVDTGTVSLGEGYLVMLAARLLREGLPAEEAARRIEALHSTIHIYVMLDNLLYLQRGGRIGRAQSLLGTLLSVKPIVTITDEVQPYQRVRTVSRALDELVAAARKNEPLETIYVGHSAAPELARDLVGRLQPLLPDRPIETIVLGPVVGSHIGAGCVGLVAVQQPRTSDST
jgi:fatty acid kinase fatty acid binding subunit